MIRIFSAYHSFVTIVYGVHSCSLTMENQYESSRMRKWIAKQELQPMRLTFGRIP